MLRAERSLIVDFHVDKIEGVLRLRKAQCRITGHIDCSYSGQLVRCGLLCVAVTSMRQLSTRLIGNGNVFRRD